jgi:hypothetical protein
MNGTKLALTVDEAKRAKFKLEQEIEVLLQNFTDMCQCEVNSIHVDVVFGQDREVPVAYSVEVDAKL